MAKHTTNVPAGTGNSITVPTRKRSPTTSSTPTFEQLKRAPIVPEAVLKRHHAYCAIDTRFRAAARLQQALWLKSRNIATAADAHPDKDGFLGSILSVDAARAGQNFLSADIHQLAVREWLFSEHDAAIDPERLFFNALSSMPLCMSLIGPLALDLDLATAVFRILFPDFVHAVHHVLFEHTPSARDRSDTRWLGDRSAVDFAVHVTTPDGEPGIIYGEIKLSEATTTAARMRDRYNEASHQVRLYRDPNSATLRSVAVEQLWREHMLAQLAVDNGVTPRALFSAVAPQLNRNAQVAFKIYEAELLDADQREPDRVAFAPLSLEAFIHAIAQAGACELAQALWGRYCDLSQVVRLAIQEYANDDIASFSYQTTACMTTKDAPSLPPARHPTRAPKRRRAPQPSHTERGRHIRHHRTVGGMMSTIELLTDADRICLFANALADDCDHFPVLKLFSPDAGATWLISEVDPDDPDRLFGLCDLGLGFPELGYVSLAEITSVKGRLGLPVERDLHFVADKPLSAYAEEARTKGRIVA